MNNKEEFEASGLIRISFNLTDHWLLRIQKVGL